MNSIYILIIYVDCVVCNCLWLPWWGSKIQVLLSKCDLLVYPLSFARPMPPPSHPPSQQHATSLLTSSFSTLLAVFTRSYYQVGSITVHPIVFVCWTSLLHKAQWKSSRYLYHRSMPSRLIVDSLVVFPREIGQEQWWLRQLSNIETHTAAGGKGHLDTDRQMDRQQYRQTDRQTDKQTDRQAGRQTGKQADRHIYRHTDRQTNIHTYIRLQSAKY